MKYFLFFIIFTTAICYGLAIQSDTITTNKEYVTIQNEKYKFELTVPKNWTYKRVAFPDPDESFKSGRASFSISSGSNEEEPKDWNGLAFNNAGRTSDEILPFVSIYIHDKPDQKAEDFAKIFNSSVSMYRGQILKENLSFASGDAKGFDYIYNLITKCRFAALYQDGKRVVFHSMVPSMDTKLFDKYAEDVERVISSFRFKNIGSKEQE